MNEKTLQPNPFLAWVAAIAGILCFTVVPMITADAMNLILRGIPPKVAASGNPLLASAPKIVIGFFPVWNGLSVAAGMALLLVAWALFRGESWAKPAAVGLLAIPAITGAYYSGPIMSFAKSKMYYFIVVALIGLVPYFIILLSGKGSTKEKVGRFFLFLMLGVTSAWTFSNGGSSLRMFWARPEPIYILDQGNLAWLLGYPVAWIGVVVTLISIPILAARKRLGHLLAGSGLLIILMGNLMLFIFHTETQEYILGVMMAAVALVLLWLPNVGGKMVEREPLAVLPTQSTTERPPSLSAAD
jgi:hypothetical protein